MQNQKGFIQIPLLIVVIALIVFASAGTGVVLHKQGKLSPLVANISEVFKGTEEAITLEGEEIEQEVTKSPEKTELEIIEEKNQELKEAISETAPESYWEERIREEGYEKPGEEKVVVLPPEEGKETDLERVGVDEKEKEIKEEVNPCVDVICPACQYCKDGKCVYRSDGYNDCGSGCQRCVSGQCQDYDNACIGISQCENDNCIRKILNVCVNCLGTDTSCGCLNCTDCNKLDGWVNVGNPYHSDLGPGGFYFNQKQEYRDYFCSGTFCEYKVTKTQTKRTWIKSSPHIPYKLPKDVGKIYPFDSDVMKDPGPIIPFK